MVALQSLPLFDARPSLIVALKDRYAEPHRRYHTWAHIQQMLDLCEKISARLHERAAVLYAICYHDAIYNVASSTNEEDSAALFEKDARQRLSIETIELVKRFVIATKTPDTNDDLSHPDQSSDCAYFLDLDISTLGAPARIYDEYARNIRQEYEMFPDPVYNAGRLKVLNEFLAKERIFLTDCFYERWEQSARDNIAREMEGLRK